MREFIDISVWKKKKQLHMLHTATLQLATFRIDLVLHHAGLELTICTTQDKTMLLPKLQLVTKKTLFICT